MALLFPALPRKVAAVLASDSLDSLELYTSGIIQCVGGCTSKMKFGFLPLSLPNPQLIPFLYPRNNRNKMSRKSVSLEVG